MLLSSSQPTMRKALAALVILVVAGLAPATALAAFCAKMPCCFGEAHDGPAFDRSTTDCCNTISCYEPPPNDFTVAAKAKVFVATTHAVFPASLVSRQVVPLDRMLCDHPPPRTGTERLSTLSVFLI